MQNKDNAGWSRICHDQHGACVNKSIEGGGCEETLLGRRDCLLYFIFALFSFSFSHAKNQHPPLKTPLKRPGWIDPNNVILNI